jgi:vitamin B12 transporter
MMKRTTALVFSLVTLLPAGINVLSQQGDSVRTYPIDEVIISGKRIEMNPLDLGRSVSIYGEEELKDSPYDNIGELLSLQEGINVIGSYQNPGALQRIYMRGTSANQTLVLVDGIRITDPASVENALDLSELSLSNIKRIEVVRGSHSTYYGNSAIGGVINIYTRKKAKNGFNANAGLKAGSFGKSTSEFNQDLFLNYTFNSGFYINGEIFNCNVNGLDAIVDTTSGSPRYNADRDDFHKTDIAGKIGFKNSRWDAYLSYKKIRQLTDLDDGAFRNDDNHTHKSDRDMVNYGVKYNINDNINFDFYGGYNDISRTVTDDSSVIGQIETMGEPVNIYDQTYTRNNYRGTVINNEVQLSYRGRNMNAFIGGNIYRETMTDSFYLYSNSIWGIYESGENLDTLDLNYVNRSIFAHMDFDGSIVSNKLKNFNLALGSRLNNHSSYGNNLSYEINPSVRIGENSVLYFSYATGFNSPSLYRLYYPNEYYASGISRGNPGLKPEISQSWEFGLKQSINNNTIICISYFDTRIENSIEYVYLWDGSIPVDSLGNDYMRDDHRGDTYLNLGTQNIRGMELSYRTRISRRFSLSANFTILNGVLKYNPSQIDTVHTSGHHVQLFTSGEFISGEVEKSGLVRRSNTANLTVGYQPARIITLTATLRYVGPRTDLFYDSDLGPWGAQGILNIDDYTLLDLNARIQITDNLKLHMNIENILNTEYSEILGYTTRGRGLSLIVRYIY